MAHHTWSSALVSPRRPRQGGLLWRSRVGRNNGTLQAYNDLNGKLLWTSPKLAAGANAAPMTYSVNGKQYVAIYAGGNSLVNTFGKVTTKPGSSSTRSR